MNFLSLKPEAFGLDISDLSLKILKLKKRRKFFSLASFVEERIKPGIIEGGEIKDEEKLTEILKEAVKKVKGEKLKTKYCVVSLPEEKAFLQVIQMPPMPKEDLKSAVLFEAENYIPLPVEKVYLDSQIISPVSPSLNKVEVLISAIPREIADSYLACLKKAGLQPLAFEIESLAIARAVIKNEESDFPVLIVDIGETRTSFIIFAGKSVRFTSSIAVSGQLFTQSIAKNLKISLVKAEELKRKYGLGEKIVLKLGEETKKEKGEIFEALIPPLVDLTQQIKKCLSYFETHDLLPFFPPERKKIQKIILSGGGANLKGLLNFLKYELNLPVVLGDSFINLPLAKSEFEKMPFEKSLSFTTAVGLALRGIEKND
jgi:type IV pilus assembly protein PilM